MSVHWVACGTCYSKTEGTELGGIKLQRTRQFFQVGGHYITETFNNNTEIPGLSCIIIFCMFFLSALVSHTKIIIVSLQ